jgi:hypothetical protein
MNYDVNKHHWQRYLKFIRSRKPSTGYVEQHHIYPRSLFPQKANDADNLIALTAREHFLAHWMLHKAFGGKMTQAFMYMKAECDDQKRHWRLNSSSYQLLREAFSQAMSVAKTGKPLSEETKRKMSEARIGKPLPESQRLAIGAGNKGKIVSVETRLKISQATVGIAKPPISDAHRAKLSVPKQRVNCTCCGKEVSVNMVNRWHNDNCKMKVEA